MPSPGVTEWDGPCGPLPEAGEAVRGKGTADLSRDLPVIVIAVDTKEKIDRVMPKIDGMISGGMVTMEPTTVIRYAHKLE